MIGPKAYIDLNRLKQNIWNIRRNIGERNLMIVVKANGYGHGALDIAKHLSDEPGMIFCVFTIDEAIELRNGGINNSILIFSRIQKDWLKLAYEHKLWINACHLDDLELLLERVEIIKNEREWMFDRLSEIPFMEPIPSDANFILTKIVNLESVELYNRLLSKGILVRYYENELLKNYLRISIGSREQNQKLLDFIKQ